MLNFDESSLADFLKDIMQTSPGAGPRGYLGDPSSQVYTPRDVLNFAIDPVFDLSDIDFGLPMPTFDKPPQVSTFSGERGDMPFDGGTRTPDMRKSISLGTQAFKRSLWQWTPAEQDHGYSHQLNLSLPYKDMESPETRVADDVQLFDQRLDESTRDKILAMVLSTCEPAMFARVVSSFPTAELLNNLMHHFFSFELSKTDSWIHLPTFRPNNQRPEVIGIIVAAGAVLSAVHVIRKLGFALQEAVRLAIPVVV